MTESWENHVRHLEKEHQALNKQIDTMERTGIYEDRRIEDLKKQRLHIKDEITRIKQAHKL